VVKEKQARTAGGFPAGSARSGNANERALPRTADLMAWNSPRAQQAPRRFDHRSHNRLDWPDPLAGLEIITMRVNRLMRVGSRVAIAVDYISLPRVRFVEKPFVE
jgi:hypothetical protein